MNWKYFNYSEWLKENAKFDHEALDKQLESARIESAGDLFKWCTLVEKLTRPPWKPHVYYNEEGDILDVTLSNVAYIARWLTPHITILIEINEEGKETGEIVGFQIWGLKHVITSGDL